MLKFLDVNARKEFVSKTDEGDPKTVFVLKPLTGFEMMDFISPDNQNNIKMSGSQIKKVIQTSLVEVRNAGDLTIENVVDALDVGVASEIFMEIMSLNKLTDTETKNS